MKPHRLPVRVYHEDTDVYGVVHHANFLRYCERGRVEFMRDLGFELKNMETEQGLLFPIVAANLTYQKPATLDDELTVLTYPKEIKRCSIVFEQVVQRDAETLCVVEIVVVCTTTDFKVKPLPTHLKESL